MLWLQESVQVLHRIKLRLIKKHSRMEIGLIFPFLCLFQWSWFSIFPRCDFFDFIFVYFLLLLFTFSVLTYPQSYHTNILLIARCVNLAFLVSFWLISKSWFEKHIMLRSKQNLFLFWNSVETSFWNFKKEIFYILTNNCKVFNLFR